MGITMYSTSPVIPDVVFHGAFKLIFSYLIPVIIVANVPDPDFGARVGRAMERPRPTRRRLRLYLLRDAHLLEFRFAALFQREFVALVHCPLSAAQVQPNEFRGGDWLRLIAAYTHCIEVMILGDDEVGICGNCTIGEFVVVNIDSDEVKTE